MRRKDYDDDDAHDAHDAHDDDDDDAPTFLRALPSHPALAARRAPRRPASRAPRREVLFCRRGWSLPVRVLGGVAWPRRGGEKAKSNHVVAGSLRRLPKNNWS